MTRRPFAATLLATGLLLGAAGIVQAGTTLDRVLARKTLVAVVDPSYPPFTFLNDKNQMDGFDIAISKAVVGQTRRRPAHRHAFMGSRQRRKLARGVGTSASAR